MENQVDHSTRAQNKTLYDDYVQTALVSLMSTVGAVTSPKGINFGEMVEAARELANECMRQRADSIAERAQTESDDANDDATIVDIEEPSDDGPSPDVDNEDVPPGGEDGATEPVSDVESDPLTYVSTNETAETAETVQ
jgi:hypothetical protein